MTKKSKKSDIQNQSNEESLKDHQGVTNFKGSGYKGKGNPDHSKYIHNRKRR